ncbi:MAG TPA: glutathione S-transferase family protein [Polyangiaceae bacterium]
MKLYQFPLSPNCQKVRALAYEVGLPLQTITLNVFKGESRTPEILAKNPNGKIPILEDADFVLWESNAMLVYLATKAGRMDLAPTAPRERADVDRWLAWHNAHFGSAVAKVAFERIVKKLGNLGAPDELQVKKGIDEFAAAARVLDACLADREYLCGSLTIADFALTTYAAIAGECGLSLDSYPNAATWRARMIARPSVRRVLAEARAAA